MRFLGMAGYYQQAFEQINAILMVSRVHSSPNFEKESGLKNNARDVGFYAVSLQENKDDVFIM